MTHARAALLAALLLLPLGMVAAKHDGANRAPFPTSIHASAYSGATIYTIGIVDLDKDNATFVWNATVPCGTFESPPPNSPNARNAAQWTWRAPDFCGARPTGGFVQVVASDGHGHALRAYYLGGEEGTGPVSTYVEDDDPKDEPEPVIVGEALCTNNTAEGRYAPSQGVWQDDDDFPDDVGKQLSVGEDGRLVAELPMVQDKPTLLFGTRGSRYEIPYNVTLSGSAMGDVRVRFQTFEFASSRLQTLGFYPPRGSLKLNAFGPCTTGATEHPIRIPVPRGFPEDRAFRLEAAGDYRVVMELVDARERPIPGTKVELEGEIVDMPLTKVRLTAMSLGALYRMPPEGPGPELPTALGGGRLPRSPFLVRLPERDAALDDHLARLARDVQWHMTDMYPLAGSDLWVKPERIMDGWLDLGAIESECRVEAYMARGDVALNEFICISGAVRAVVFAEAMTAMWTDGARATVLVLPPGTYQLLQGSAAGPFGEGIGPKLAMVQQNVDQPIVAHEIAHVTPWLFSAEGDCGRDFHLVETPMANGFRITHNGTEAREARDDSPGLMGDQGPLVEGRRVWIEQCTYWHLLHELKTKKDPALQAVALEIFRDAGGNASAKLLAGRTMEGEPDLIPGGEGSHALVLRDAGGAELARYAFEPRFRVASGAPVPSALVAMRVERPASAARLEVEGPDGVLLARALSASRPTVSVEPLQRADDERLPNGSYALRYAASGGDGALTYSAYASDDDGRSWRMLVPRTDAPHALLDAGLFAPGRHLVRVVASDGLQSGEATVELVVEDEPAPRGVPGALAGLVVAAALVAARLRRR